MSTFITVLGLVGLPLALAFTFWCLLAEIGRVRDLNAAADIARIEEGWAETTTPDPEPVEPEPFRRIDWEVDEQFEAMVRASRWPTDTLFWIKAVEPVCA